MFNNYQKPILLILSLSSLDCSNEEDIKNNVEVKASNYKNVIFFILKMPLIAKNISSFIAILRLTLNHLEALI